MPATAKDLIYVILLKRYGDEKPRGAVQYRIGGDEKPLLRINPDEESCV